MTTSGAVYCWGQAPNLGVDTATNYGSASGQMAALPPVAVGGAPIAIAASNANLYAHTCALLGEPLRIQCWGLGTSGQLGRGSTSDVGCGSATCGGTTNTLMNATAPVAI